MRETSFDQAYRNIGRRVITLALPALVPGLLGLTAIAQPGPARSGPHPVLRIAAAADLQPVMPRLAQEYEQQTGVKLQVSLGSSGALTTQILNGLPVDLFLAADYASPEQVVAAGLADASSPTPYAEGTLVLWTRKDSGVSPLSVDRLTEPNVARIAIAEAFHAPYGRAAAAALDALKLTDKVKGKLVTAENVAQAAQFAESGNAQVAFISLTLASTEHMQQVGRFERVPAVYPKIRQCGVVLNKSPHREEARKFLAWLISAKVQEQLTRFGLEPAH